MKYELSMLFSYPARTEALETLFRQPGELGLRQVALISGQGIRSIQLALQDLHAHGLVLRRRDGSRVFFRLNRKHEVYPLLDSVFTAAEMFRIAKREAEHSKRGSAALAFSESALKMLNTGRASHNATR